MNGIENLLFIAIAGLALAWIVIGAVVAIRVIRIGQAVGRIRRGE